MSRTKKKNALPVSWGGPWWRDPERPWRYISGPPAWFRRLLNRISRRRQDRAAQDGEILATKRDLRWRWW
jgi:hypothetical protein